jgi:uncharacterized GH25 family protein
MFACAKSMRLGVAGLMILAATIAAHAHDTWVQTNTNLVRVNDVVHVDLMLGNHSNDHRDYKLASKISLDSIASFEVIDPDGQKHDLKKSAADLGLDPKEGFWSSRFTASKPGTYVAVQTADKTMAKKGKGVRVVRSAKAYFVASPSLDKVAKVSTGFDRPLGHRFELVADSNPVVGMQAGSPMKVRLLYDGKPLPDARISFIPRGVSLETGFDKNYERMTDREGRAEFTPKQGNYYLVVAHQTTDEKGEGFESTHYSATLTVFVPQVCPCCDE